jgi:hypothetical protein
VRRRAQHTELHHCCHVVLEVVVLEVEVVGHCVALLLSQSTLFARTANAARMQRECSAVACMCSREYGPAVRNRLGSESDITLNPNMVQRQGATALVLGWAVQTEMGFNYSVGLTTLPVLLMSCCWTWISFSPSSSACVFCRCHGCTPPINACASDSSWFWQGDRFWESQGALQFGLVMLPKRWCDCRSNQVICD